MEHLFHVDVVSSHIDLGEKGEGNLHPSRHHPGWELVSSDDLPVVNLFSQPLEELLVKQVGVAQRVLADREKSTLRHFFCFGVALLYLLNQDGSEALHPLVDHLSCYSLGADRRAETGRENL